MLNTALLTLRHRLVHFAHEVGIVMFRVIFTQAKPKFKVGQVDPLVETTNETLTAPAGTPGTGPAKAPRQSRQPRQMVFDGTPSEGRPRI